MLLPNYDELRYGYTKFYVGPTAYFAVDAAQSKTRKHKHD